MAVVIVVVVVGGGGVGVGLFFDAAIGGHVGRVAHANVFFGRTAGSDVHAQCDGVISVGRFRRFNARFEKFTLRARLFEYSIVDNKYDQKWNVKAQRSGEQRVGHVFVDLAYFIGRLRRLPADLRRQRNYKA